MTGTASVDGAVRLIACNCLLPKWVVGTHNPAGHGLFKIETLRSCYLSQSLIAVLDFYGRVTRPRDLILGEFIDGLPLPRLT
jgi:hypothetical protein